MGRSRILEGHVSINGFLRLVAGFEADEVTWEVQKLGDFFLGAEYRRWTNSGEMGFTRHLDGFLEALSSPEGASQDPHVLWANARYGRRQSDNTTPPMAVLRHRALSASCVLMVREDPLQKVKETSPMAEMSPGSRSQFYYKDQTLEDIWENFPEDFNVKIFAHQNGLLPYEAACLISQIGQVPVPSDHTLQDDFLRHQYQELFL